MCVRVRFACAMHVRVLRGSKYNGGMQRNAFQLFLVEPIRKYTHCGLNIVGDMRVHGMHAAARERSRVTNGTCKNVLRPAPPSDMILKNNYFE